MVIRLTFLFICLATTVTLHASEPRISEMYVNNKMFCMVEDRPLSYRADGNVSWTAISPDGKHAAFVAETETSVKLCIVSSSGGKPKVIAERPIGPHLDKRRKPASWLLDDLPKPVPIAWSPDSKMIVYPSEHIPAQGSQSGNDRWLVVAGVDGSRVAAVQFTIEQGYLTVGSVTGLQSPLMWSPTSSRLAFIQSTVREDSVPGTGGKRIIFLFDVSRNELIKLFSWDKGTLEMHGWKNDGRILRIRRGDGARSETWDLSPDGTAPFYLSDRPIDPLKSPDEAYQLIVDEHSVFRLKDTSAEQVRILNLDRTMNFLKWAPNSRIFACIRPDALKDESGVRYTTLHSLWLVTVEQNKLNTMCVALNADSQSELSWSSDCERMSYISDGRVYVTSFDWRRATSRDRYRAGVKLSEQDIADIAFENTAVIMDALYRYVDQHNGKWPEKQFLLSELSPYLGKRTDAYYLPGSNDTAFSFSPPLEKDKNINPALLCIGSMNLGSNSSRYINMYMDWRVDMMGPNGLIRRQWLTSR